MERSIALLLQHGPCYCSVGFCSSRVVNLNHSLVAGCHSDESSQLLGKPQNATMLTLHGKQGYSSPGRLPVRSPAYVIGSDASNALLSNVTVIGLLYVSNQ